MARKCRVLWIEDEATHNLKHLYSPLITSIKHDLTLSVTTSEAMHYLRNEEYDVVVFDLRIDPGKDQVWVNLYNRLIQPQTNGFVRPVRLGLHLLFNLLGVYKKDSIYYVPIQSDVQTKFRLNKLGVLSVDDWREISRWLKEHSNEFVDEGQEAFKKRFSTENQYYIHKRIGMSNLTLKRLVNRIHQSPPSPPNSVKNSSMTEKVVTSSTDI